MLTTKHLRLKISIKACPFTYWNQTINPLHSTTFITICFITIFSNTSFLNLNYYYFFYTKKKEYTLLIV
jgi:hypothetical protein